MDALTPQQEALRTVRERYERGAIDYDTFRDAFEALLKTTDPAECQRILAELPTAPTDVLAALDRTSAPALPTRPAGPSLPRHRRFFTLMGEINRTRHPWKMGEQTSGVALMGEINLDLTLAALPARGVLRVALLMGEVRITVPENVSVTVHAFTFMGSTRALGERSEGIFAFAQDDDERAAATHHLDIHVFLLMGEVRVQRSGTTATLPARA
jgi:hypothetical protein